MNKDGRRIEPTGKEIQKVTGGPTGRDRKKHISAVSTESEEGERDREKRYRRQRVIDTRIQGDTNGHKLIKLQEIYN